MADDNNKDLENLDKLDNDTDTLGKLSREDFEDMEIMREDETFATMVEEHISDEEMDELTRAFQELEDQIAAPSLDESFASMELDEGEFGDLSEDDLDAMLKSLMDKDDEESEDWVPIDDVDAELEQEPEIYEGENADTVIDLSVLQPDEKPKRSRPHKWISQQLREGDKVTKVLVVAILGMGSLVVASLVFLAVVLFTGNDAETQGSFNISPPSYALNNARHALVGIHAPMGEDTIILNRLLLDEAATSFYFAGDLDLARYIFALEDIGGRVYARNLTLSSNPTRNYALNQTVVRFEPVDPLAGGIVLSITDLHTGRDTAIGLTFDSDAIALGRHITNPIEVDAGSSEISVSIDHGVFSAAASSINFSITSASNNVSLVFVENPIVSPVGLRHMGSAIPVVSDMQISDFSHNGIMLGAVDFNPLRTLTGRVEVVFSSVYMQYDMGLSIPTDGMFAGDDRSRTLNLADHVIAIHGIEHRGDIFAMPLFGIAWADRFEEEPARLPTTMEVSLVGIDNAGRRVSLAGTVRYDARGTDVIFDASENPAILDIPRNSLHLEFGNISLRIPEFSVLIDLDELGFEPSIDANVVKAGIESFIAQDMPQFARDFGALQNVEYAVQVRQLHIVGNNAYAFAIERLAFTNADGLQEVVRHHNLVVNLNTSELVSNVIEIVE
ncbi:MAG: hypothetical protein FWE34_06610 [Defluviitaleaceae bacterium]|nr:hypothetical protein [Defluviitaleaceae bacterium]